MENVTTIVYFYIHTYIQYSLNYFRQNHVANFSKRTTAARGKKKKVPPILILFVHRICLLIETPNLRFILTTHQNHYLDVAFRYNFLYHFKFQMKFFPCENQM